MLENKRISQAPTGGKGGPRLALVAQNTSSLLQKKRLRRSGLDGA